MAKIKSTKPLPNANLIRGCVLYAQALAAFSSGFQADPDGSSKTAEKLGTFYLVMADRALDKITKLRATSWFGLDAKRRVAQMIMRDCIHTRACSIEIEQAKFLEVFIADVKTYLTNEVTKDDLAKLEKAA